MDDLNTPLGKDKTPAPSGLPRKLLSARLAGRAIAGLLSLGLVGFVLWAALVRDPLGGEPTASAPVAPVQTADSGAGKPEPKADMPVQPAAPAPPAVPPGSQTITIIDGSSGKRQEVLIPASGDALRKAAADPRLIETSRHGPIPRIAADGSRPSQVYARKVDKAAADGPQIAIVIGGLGLSANATADALAKLPPNMTFAFTPYGNELDAQVSRARDKGHEVLLQIPMEPQDYPDNDPGPQTLLSSLPAEQNVDRLHWLFSRMQGYVGIVNFMGARFTASDAAMAPVLREVAKRGLIYVDDGGSPRSQAAQIAGASKLTFAKADVVIDAVSSPAEIDKALGRLEAAARDRGMAVGFSSALPASIDRIAKWAKAAQGRGIMLVPITRAAAGRTGSS